MLHPLSEETLHAFCARIWSKQLNDHIRYIVGVCGSDADLYKVLNKARAARNEVAHEVALGFEHWAYEESLSTAESARIRELATSLAHADHLLCTLESLLSHEPMPSGDAHRTYVERLVSWVCNTDNGDPW